MKTKNSQSKNSSLKQMILYEQQQIDLTIQLVEGLASGRLSPEQIEKVKRERERIGPRIYSDMIFLLVNIFFSPTKAEGLWNSLLDHKTKMELKLANTVSIQVAALDYFQNHTDLLNNPVIMPSKKQSKLTEVAIRDGLTKLYNKDTFYAQARIALRAYRNYKTPFSIAILDIDDFKVFNDKHGHLAGDKLLVTLAKVIRRTLQGKHMVFRFGGEEFTILFRNIDLKEALILSEKVRYSVENNLVHFGVTASFGVANCPSNGTTVKEILGKADSAMYRAKQQGKNQVLSLVEE